MRYDNIITLTEMVPEKYFSIKIPKLTLQPLVENALYHGIKYKRARGFIYITGKKEGENLYLEVCDNGVGMNRESLEHLQKEIERPCSETSRGFGLANVNERIRMNFGAEYGMKIDSVKGKGTCVEIVIPAVPYAAEKED